MLKSRIIIVMWLVMCVFAFNAHARFIDTTQCYFSDDVFYDGRTQYVVRTLPEVFYNACAQECLKYTKLRSCSLCIDPKDCTSTASSIGVSDYNLNIDIILDCQTKCRSGGSFASDFRLNTISPPAIFGSDYNMCKMPSISTNISAPTSSINLNALETDFTVTANENIIVILNQPPKGYANEVAMCGHTAKVIEPSFSSGIVTRSLRDSDWGGYPVDKSSWHARNWVPYDTGIDIMDGDDITITYQGEYRTRGSAYHYKWDNSLFIRKALTSTTTSWNVGSLNEVYNIDGAKVVPSTDGGDSPSTYPTVGTADMGVIGLQGSSVGILQSRYPPAATSYTINNNPATTVTKYERNITIQGIVTGYSTKFSRLGIIHGDTDVAFHPEWYIDNLGGYRVTIERKGCVKRNGQDLQYGVGTYITSCLDANNNAIPHCIIGTYNLPTTWYDVSASGDISGYQPVTLTMPNIQGKLFFRIKPLDPLLYQNSKPTCNAGCASNPSSDICTICNDTLIKTQNYFAPGASDGQYFITLKRQLRNNVTAFISDVISFPIRLLHYYLFGDLQTRDFNGEYCSTDALNFIGPYRLDCGVVPKIFNAFIADGGYIPAIRAALVLYFVISAISFLGGFAPMTEREFVNRMLKVGVIVALISPRSWEFFNTQVFQIFVDGALQIMVYVANISQTGGLVNMTLDQARTNFGDVFGFFDLTFSIIMSKVIWFKIFAILFSSFYGIFMIVAIFNSFFCVMKSLLKAAVLYAMNLIGIGILLMLAPLFISFMLFKTTFPMFDAWVKQLLAYAIQPIVVLICLFILNTLLLFVLHKVFEFTICSVCFLGIFVPFVDISICFLYGYVALSSMFSLSIFTLPIKLFATAFFLSVIASAMEHFVEFGSQLAGNIVAQGNSIDYASQGNRRSMIAEQTASLMPFPTSLGGNSNDSMKTRIAKSFINEDLYKGGEMGRSLLDKLKGTGDGGNQRGGNNQGGGNANG